MKKHALGRILGLFLLISLSLPQFSTVQAQACNASDIPRYDIWTYDREGNGRIEDYFCGNAGDVLYYNCENCVVPFTITSSSGKIITEGYGDVTLPATGRYKVIIGYNFGVSEVGGQTSCRIEEDRTQCGSSDGGGCMGVQVCDTVAGSTIGKPGQVKLYLTLKSSGLSSSSSNSSGSSPAVSATTRPKVVATALPYSSSKTTTSFNDNPESTRLVLLLAGVFIVGIVIFKFVRGASSTPYVRQAPVQSLGTRLGNLDAPRSSIIPPTPIEPQSRASTPVTSNGAAFVSEPKPSVIAPTPINPVTVEPLVTNPWLKKPDVRPTMPSVDQSSTNSTNENNDTDTPKPNPWLKK